MSSLDSASKSSARVLRFPSGCPNMMLKMWVSKGVKTEEAKVVRVEPLQCRNCPRIFQILQSAHASEIDAMKIYTVNFTPPVLGRRSCEDSLRRRFQSSLTGTQWVTYMQNSVSHRFRSNILHTVLLGDTTVGRRHLLPSGRQLGCNEDTDPGLHVFIRDRRSVVAENKLTHITRRERNRPLKGSAGSYV